MTTAAPPGDESRMTLVEHLTELRSRLVKTVIAVVIGLVVAFVLYDQIFDVLIRPYERSHASDTGFINGGLLVTDPLEGFAVRLKISAYGGIALAMPVILWQLWRFVTPGLYPRERRYAIPFVASAVVLFALGAALAYYTLPRALDFLADIGGENLVTAYSPGKYFQLITYMMLAFGIGFEFPILLIFLQLAGVVDAGALRRGRRFAIVGICVLVAVITPSGDPISMLVLSVPMVLFYEASILAGRFIARRQATAASG